LCHDQYLRSLMDCFGWVRIADVLSLAGVRQTQASAEDVAAAVKTSNLIQASGDLRQIRARNPASWAAFAPRSTSESAGAYSPISATQAEFVPEVDVADEDLTIAACIDPAAPRASKEGSPWPCVEWLTAEPFVAEPCLDWLLSDDQPPKDEDIGEPSSPGVTPAAVPYQGAQGTRSRRRRPRRRSSKQQAVALDWDLPASDPDADLDLASSAFSPTSSAWLRLSDDAYPSAAGSLLQW